MESQTFILASIVLCSLGGWYVVITKYLALKQMVKDPNEKLPPHIPGMGPAPIGNETFMMPEDLLPAEQHSMHGALAAARPTIPNPQLEKRIICNQTCILHLLGFGIISGIPFLNVLLPTMYWLWHKEQHPFFAKQGREIINFQITFTLIQFICLGAGTLYIRYAPESAANLFAWTKILKLVFASGMFLPFNIFTVIPFFWSCVVMIRGAVAAYHGVAYKYPIAQQFLVTQSANSPVPKEAKRASPKQEKIQKQVSFS